MIRPYQEEDILALQKIRIDNGLPPNCMPDPTDPLMLAKLVVEQDGKPVMAGMLKCTSEAYVLIDHNEGSPHQRWQWLQELTEQVKNRAWELGLSDITVWIPPEIEISFGKRLQALNFVKSPWHSYTAKLDDYLPRP